MLTLANALILLLAIEGSCLALFPGPLRRAMREIAGQPDTALRRAGLIAVALAVILALLFRYLH